MGTLLKYDSYLSKLNKWKATEFGKVGNIFTDSSFWINNSKAKHCRQQETIDVWSDFGDTTVNISEVNEYHSP